MRGLGDFVARGVTYVNRIDGELYDGGEDETIGTEGQTMIVCDEVEALPCRDEAAIAHKQVVLTEDRCVGHYECSMCHETVFQPDRYCRRCGAILEEVA